MSLIQKLNSGALDIVGDVHGELDALESLLDVLGYKANGAHPEQRQLVFIGDYCDRGPNSPAVIELVQKFVENGPHQAILGNHEVNLLANDPKDGSGWFFDARYKQDLSNYAPFQTATQDQKDNAVRFLDQLPLALEREDLRVIHAAWQTSSIDVLRERPASDIGAQFLEFETKVIEKAKSLGLWDAYQEEQRRWRHKLENSSSEPPFLQATAEYEVLYRDNPFRPLAYGPEVITSQAFFSGSRWRFMDRLAWWDHYKEATPVVIGHYWRLFRPDPSEPQSRYSQLFKNIDSCAWHGYHKNVFCVDYSVGARWRDRRAGRDPKANRFRLAALQWPERNIVFENGDTMASITP